MLLEIGSLVRDDPAQATERILQALRAARGNRHEAARSFGLRDPRTLYRWIERLGIWPKVDALAKEEGWPGSPSPRAGERIVAAMLRVNGDRLRAARALGVKPNRLLARIKELKLNAEIRRLLAARRSRPC